MPMERADEWFEDLIAEVALAIGLGAHGAGTPISPELRTKMADDYRACAQARLDGWLETVAPEDLGIALLGRTDQHGLGSY